MGLRESKTLRTIFIKNIFSLGIFIILLILVNYLLFGVASIGVYPANYSERIIQKNLGELKNSPKVTMDLLTPMCRFGVYSEGGDFLYGNFSDKDIDANWETYNQRKYSIGSSYYITSIAREEGILIISYPLKMQFTSPRLRRTLPNAELTITFIFIFQLLILIILWSNRFSRRINNELKILLHAVEKIEEQDLEFDIGTSNVEDIDIVLQGIDKMKNSLKIALEKQWLLEKQKREQISALAHDVKTPLTIVKGNIGLLRETDMTEEQKSYCVYVEQSSIQMEGYLQRLLSITKEEIDNVEANKTIYIQELIGFLKNQGVALARIKGIHIINNMNIEENIYLKANELELKRAFMNIITNAVDFSPNKSVITINSLIDKYNIIIQVIDQGKGFSNKMIKYGKEQFSMEDGSRTKSGHHGLGLYIANTIIKKYDGELLLTNNRSGGGIVTVRIPKYREEGEVPKDFNEKIGQY